MKLAGFLLVLLAFPAFPQSAGSHGTRIGQIQTAYFADLPGGPPARTLDGSRVVEVPPGGTGPRAEFETWVEQTSRDYAESVVTGFAGIERGAGKAAIHRFVRDNFRKVELTYTMTLETVPGAEAFRVSFSDSVVPYPAPQILRDGETIALDLSVDARTGRRMVDYIRVGTGLMKPRQEAARDVYADDAELTIAQPRLRINGVEDAATGPAAQVSAPIVWVTIPGHGQYDLSFKPRADEGFEKAGEVAEHSLVLRSGGDIFRIDCADRIATGSGTYNIYARKVSAADLPADPGQFTFGARR